MKAPLNWLRDYVALDETPQAVADILRMAGLGTEAIAGDVIDLEITANRADLLSMLGVAREAALTCRRTLRVPDVNLKEGADPVETLFRVTVEDRGLCPRYTARLVRGVRVGPSPDWMRKKLEAAGVRAVNVIVDITNYVQLECGQPLHAFDAAKLDGGTVVVRRARAGEKMTAIDGSTCTLTPEMLVIADAKRPVAIAGVMGGRETEIGPSSVDVLIESAQFDPVSIRRTSRRLGLSSESSYRFERGVDWETVAWASCRAAALMTELSGGTLCRGVIDVAGPPPVRESVRLRSERVLRILGMKVPDARIGEILTGLGCTVKPESGGWKVETPAARRDLREEADLIEEIVRVEGYDKLPSVTSFEQRVAVDRPDDTVRMACRETLTGLGAWEVCTWSFEEAGAKNWIDFWSGQPLIPLKDPQGKVDHLLRSSMVPELLRVLGRNASYKEPLRTVFEIATIYAPAEDGTFRERRVLTLAAPGGIRAARGFVERLLGALGIPVSLTPAGRSFLEGGGLLLRIGTENAGFVGEPSSGLAGATGAPERIGAAEIDFDMLVASSVRVSRYREFSRKPAVERDLAIIVAETVPWAEIENVVRKKASNVLSAVEVFDVYRGKPIPAGQKSVAFRMRFQSAERTLTAAESDAEVGRVTQGLQEAFQAQIRGVS